MTDAAKPILTIPETAVVLGVTLWQLVGVLGRRPDLSARVFRAGGRRLVLAADLPRFAAADWLARWEALTRPDYAVRRLVGELPADPAAVAEVAAALGVAMRDPLGDRLFQDAAAARVFAPELDVRLAARAVLGGLSDRLARAAAIGADPDLIDTATLPRAALSLTFVAEQRDPVDEVVVAAGIAAEVLVEHVPAAHPLRVRLDGREFPTDDRGRPVLPVGRGFQDADGKPRPPSWFHLPAALRAADRDLARQRAEERRREHLRRVAEEQRQADARAAAARYRASPEGQAAELERLRARVAELEQARG